MKKRNYLDSVHFYGRIWTLLALVIFLLIPVAICAHLKTWPAAPVVLKGLGAVAILFYPTGVLDVISYTALLGSGGTYLSFITGNITNLKMPCALNAMESAKVRANSEEGEVISTISIAVSAITTTIVIAVMILAFAANPAFKEAMTTGASSLAFRQVTYAVFGAIAATYFIKHWKISIIPIAFVTLLLVFAGNIQVGILIFAGCAVSLIAAHIMFKMKIV